MAKIISFLKIAGLLVGSALINLLGGFDQALIILCIFMAIDIITGVIVAAVFKNSGKTETGKLDSRAMIKGLFRKAGIFLAVIIAVQLDCLIGTNVIRSGAIIAFAVSELLSIVENMGLMGLKMPDVITNAINGLNKDKDNG